jgi:hypothetical protein
MPLGKRSAKLDEIRIDARLSAGEMQKPGAALRARRLRPCDASDAKFDAILPLRYKSQIIPLHHTGGPIVGVSYKISETQISHNRFDDETIAVNLATGSYFSFHNTAAELWNLLEQGPATADSLAAAFAGAPASATLEIAAFLQRLHGEGLLTESSGKPEQFASTHAYSTPVAEEFDELRELLLADIVHDTDEAGWPHLITK